LVRNGIKTGEEEEGNMIRKSDFVMNNQHQQDIGDRR
jgi:hypothetical protein